MTAINTKTEALELRELSSEKLDAVSGGGGKAPDPKKEQDKENDRTMQENKQQFLAMRIFRQMLNTF